VENERDLSGHLNLVKSRGSETLQNNQLCRIQGVITITSAEIDPLQYVRVYVTMFMFGYIGDLSGTSPERVDPTWELITPRVQLALVARAQRGEETALHPQL
jgi:hypothetical protein